MDYKKEKDIIKKLIKKAETERENFVILLVNTLYENNINFKSSSLLEQLSVSDLSSKDLLEIETGFRLSCNHYRFFHSSAEFLGALLLGELDTEKKLLIYATSHIDSSVIGRSILPLLASKNNMVNLTSSPYSLAISKNKFDYYKILDGLVPLPKTLILSENKKYLGDFPVIIKPSLECCAKNVNLAYCEEDVIKFCKSITSELQQNVIIQEYIDGIEINVPILKYEENNYLPLPATIIVPNSPEIFLNEQTIKNGDYHYIVPGTQEYPLDEKMINKINNYAITIAKRLNLGGLSRIDFRLDLTKGIPLAFDIASLPYLTKYDACFRSVNYLFPEDEEAIYKMLIGSCL
ncbi:ATP-grasp domain-containing protein [Vagococcus fluvialis]|jgi:D-alanine-D-alanine ligase|uniref:ATP-grasp domain-containing protein n=1 Tax=Vagococcus fluvialis TaxID=2738 RepID=UPI001A8DC1FF|nr:ATP-grasp domain-containing protein [Vagococcus fluvialis]MBO0430547.1 ATP-grasp domain-containing protein [Vagococcus fluvialis]